MKYTRVEIKSKFRKYIVVICFTILLPITALFLGKVLINYSEKEATSIAIKLNDFKSIYFLQLGVYEKEEGANEKIKHLKSKEIDSILLRDGKYFKVVSNIASTPKKLDEKKKSIESKGLAVYIKDFPIVGVEESKDGNIKEYASYVKEYILSALDQKESVMKSSYKALKKCKPLKGGEAVIQEKINSIAKSHIESNFTKVDETYLRNIIEIVVNYNKMI